MDGISQCYHSNIWVNKLWLSLASNFQQAYKRRLLKHGMVVFDVTNKMIDKICTRIFKRRIQERTSHWILEKNPDVTIYHKPFFSAYWNVLFLMELCWEFLSICFVIFLLLQYHFSGFCREKKEMFNALNTHYTHFS